MANLIIKDTGLDHLYPDGVPIVELGIDIKKIFNIAARNSALTVLADPYFSKHTECQKVFSQLHGEGDRITTNMLEKGARDILPVFSSFQRWMVDIPLLFEFNSDLNKGLIIYRWLYLDTRKHTLDYTVNTYFDVCIDPNTFSNIEKYLTDALVDFLLQELYKAIGYDKKYLEHFRCYEQNRQYVAYWLKNDRSTKTQHRNAGV